MDIANNQQLGTHSHTNTQPAQMELEVRFFIIIFAFYIIRRQ